MLPTGKNSNRITFGKQEDGFTLIELMVVLVIIGLMSSFVMLNLPASQTSVEEDVEKIAARFAAATREAVLSGETIGVMLTRSGYQFLRRRKGTWEPTEIIPKHQAHIWPSDSSVTFRLVGVRQTLPIARTSRASKVPFLVFAPTGESIPFELTLAKDGDVASVQGDYISQIKVSQ